MCRMCAMRSGPAAGTAEVGPLSWSNEQDSTGTENNPTAVIRSIHLSSPRLPACLLTRTAAVVASDTLRESERCTCTHACRLLLEHASLSHFNRRLSSDIFTALHLDN